MKYRINFPEKANDSNKSYYIVGVDCESNEEVFNVVDKIKPLTYKVDKDAEYGDNFIYVKMLVLTDNIDAITNEFNSSSTMEVITEDKVNKLIDGLSRLNWDVVEDINQMLFSMVLRFYNENSAAVELVVELDLLPPRVSIYDADTPLEKHAEEYVNEFKLLDGLDFQLDYNEYGDIRLSDWMDVEDES